MDKTDGQKRMTDRQKLEIYERFIEKLKKDDWWYAYGNRDQALTDAIWHLEAELSE